MKMNEIIRERRLKKGLTQEQMANYLGVSAPAVNKWEKGVSYPDIVLLPPLARLLDTDLNTLLSFREDLSEKEVGLFINKVSETIDEEGFEAGFQLALEKIEEYPNCDLLVGNMAMLLEGVILFSGQKKKLKEKYQTEIENLHWRAAKSSDTVVRERAQVVLISKLMEKKEYTKAQEILDRIPKKNPVDREQLQANIYIEQGELHKAEKLTEEKLLSATMEIHGILLTLMEIAIKEKRLDDAEYIADVHKKAAQLFDLWEYDTYVAHFQYYLATKKRVEFLKILLPMLKSLTSKWEVNKSPLYRCIKTKEADNFGAKLQKMIIRSIDEDEDTEFLKDDPELKKIINEIDNNH